MGLDRRTFLHQGGLALFTLLMSQTWDKNFIFPHLQTLAQPTRGKLALLVGINEYPNGNNLSGCVTDVELQRELLLYRFGFRSEDILTLTDQQATRVNIETAFTNHLIQQAQPDDVVIFHFSGYGTQVKLPQALEKNISQPTFLSSLLTTDGLLGLKDGSYKNNLWLDNLWLLVRSLPTSNYTVVLDTSHSNALKLLQSEFKRRSYETPVETLLTQEDSAFVEQLKQAKTQVNNNFRGTILKAAGDGQVAAEGFWNGFSAGLFTYALTQHLWEITPATTVSISLTKTAQKVARVMGKAQQPQVVSDYNKSLLTYYLDFESVPAQGIITSTDNDIIEIELLGLPPTVVENYGVNSCLTLPQPLNDVLLQIRSQEGFKAKARLLNKTLVEPSLQPGQTLQEKYRLFPRNLGLNVALDPNLERIERVDATSAFSSIKGISSVVNGGEQAADCLFAKIPDSAGNLGGYGLFSVGGFVLPNTGGTPNEAIKSAIKRLTPQLKTILAAKLWGLTANGGSSQLKVKAFLELVDPQSNTTKIIDNEGAGETAQSNNTKLERNKQKSFLPTVAVGSKIQYRIENNSDRHLYMILLGVEPDNQAIALCCPLSQSDPSKMIQPEQSLVLPEPVEGVNWIVSGAEGIAQMHIICAQTPFSKTMEVLATSEQIKPDKEQIIKLTNPLNIALALLQDLHTASGVAPEIVGTPSDAYAFDVNAWITLSFIYQVE